MRQAAHTTQKRSAVQEEEYQRYMPGWITRSAHQDAVDSILRPLGLYRKVRSEGTLFRNMDRWTIRFFASEMMRWASMNPGRFPTRARVRRWVEKANSNSLLDILKGIYGEEVDPDLAEPVIYIAATPDKLTSKLALALRGGAFHEALHTAYDVRDNISFEEVWPIVEENWGLLKDWSKYHKVVLMWMNEFCDVKNELRGVIDFPGIERALHAVHDNRIQEELKHIAELKEKGLYKPNSHSFALKVFRHFAFGYQSYTQDQGMDFAFKEDPRAFSYVTHGPLAKFVELARKQWELPRAASLDLAMKTVAAFRNEEFLRPESLLGDMLRREKDRITWGHCRIDQGGGEGKQQHYFQGAGTSIAEDALRDPQHQTTEESVGNAIVSATSSARTPMSYEFDKVYVMAPSHGGIGHDRKVALDLTQQVRGDVTFYRSRLRTLIKAQEIVGTHHGLADGIDLSDETLIDTVIEMRSGVYPTGAFYDEDPEIDVSTAIYTLLDMSGSMCTKRIQACKIALAVTEAASDLGCATMASGFYSTNGRQDFQQRWWDSLHGHPAEGDEGLHEKFYRPWGVHHAVFKGWMEKHQHVRWRFSNYRAQGGTPMADGMQFALNALQERTEGHRIMFVFTDGMPDLGSENMVKEALRIAALLGIKAVGVGVGSESRYVTSLFPDHVWDYDIKKIPRKMIAKLNELMDYRGTLLRGRRTSQRVVPKRG